MIDKMNMISGDPGNRVNLVCKLILTPGYPLGASPNGRGEFMKRSRGQLKNVFSHLTNPQSLISLVCCQEGDSPIFAAQKSGQSPNYGKSGLDVSEKTAISTPLPAYSP